MQVLSGEWFGYWMRAALPIGSALVVVLGANLPVSFGFSLPVAPLFALMVVYFWSMRRPDLMRAPAIFMIGFLQDALSGAPLGLSSLSMLAAITFVGASYQALANFAFGFYVFGFFLAALIYGIVATLVAVVYTQSFFSLVPLGEQILMSALIYPFVGFVLAALAKLLSPLPLLYR